MSQRRCVTSIFDDVRKVVSALKQLNEAGFRDLKLHSPVGLQELETFLPKRGSPVRFFTLAGALAGCIGGYWMSIGSAYLYNIIVGGKPPSHLLPYAVIGFEGTILFGGVVTLGAVIAFARMRPGHRDTTYDPRFTVDRYGISVYCETGQTATVRDVLQKAGAEEVHEQPE